MWTDGQISGQQTDMGKLTDACGEYAKAPKNV